MISTEQFPPAQRRLIVTADDFGLTASVNDAVENGYCNGILTTASLMVTGGAAADAVARARRLPHLRVGLHIVLVDGMSLLTKEAIPSLVDANNRFHPGQTRLGIRYFSSPRARRELAAEVRAQFEAFRQTGLQLDHANAHKHMHLHPTIAKLVIDIGREFGLRALRVPAEPPVLLRAIGGPVSVGSRLLYRWSSILRTLARKAGLVVNDYVLGIGWTGHMTADRVRRALPYLPRGLTELYLHPASQRDKTLIQLMPSYEHEAEAACLTDKGVHNAINQAGVELTNWTSEAAASHTKVLST